MLGLRREVALCLSVGTTILRAGFPCGSGIGQRQPAILFELIVELHRFWHADLHADNLAGKIGD